MKPVVLALPWYRGMYSHQKNDNLHPYLRLDWGNEEWHCCNCGREGRVMRVYGTGLVSCPKCESHFVVTMKEQEAFIKTKE